MSQNDELREQLDAIDYSIAKIITTNTPDIDGTLVEMRLSLTENAKTVIIALIQARETRAVNGFKDLIKFSDSYTFEDGTKFIKEVNGE